MSVIRSQTKPEVMEIDFLDHVNINTELYIFVKQNIPE